MVSPTSSENIECELNALVQDQLQTVTYKFLSKRFSIPYDTSKKILHAYKDKNGDVCLMDPLPVFFEFLEHRCEAQVCV